MKVSHARPIDGWLWQRVIGGLVVKGVQVEQQSVGHNEVPRLHAFGREPQSL